MNFMKIKISTLNLILLVFVTAKIVYIPSRIFLVLRYFILIYLFIYNINELKRNYYVCALLFLYTGVLTYSTHINMENSNWTLSAFMSGMQIIDFFLVFSHTTKMAGTQSTVNSFIKILAVFLVLNDIMLPIAGYNFYDADEAYLIGNKFFVSFIHLLMSCLIYYKYDDSNKKYVYLISLIYTAAISLIVNCSTGLIITIVAIGMFFIPQIFRGILSNRNVIAICLTIGNVLIWGSYAIFKSPFIQNIVVNVFHKNANMTGREKLYSIVLLKVAEKPKFGYGFNTDLFRNIFGYGNAQNGVFHIVIQAGIIGAIFYFFAIYISLGMKVYNAKLYGFIIFYYAMIIGSAIEVNLGNIFMLGVACFMAINLQDKNHASVVLKPKIRWSRRKRYE